MRIVSKTRLEQACEKHPDAEASIQFWKKLVKGQKWNSFTDVKTTVPFAPDQVKNFVIFNIGGNKYRLITCIDYKKKAIYIREFLTHAEYSKENWKNDDWFGS
ncbi:hypothetical protein SR1949_39920 [Sphaerospermopsis reniformis]|uniref:Type II toxin-antitoxin system HigB family toxin n=1 Tax=Sphaerospermopsis reniformis TaxID=531300 RepID=A0A480A5F2_9CYAN|nr:type II toxin-antitoxin system HigB family toxin [Sphaerospermopsis reniformis]GCL38873.1 hypothetical protein SR1949_39920 [Sphaerospermopsis reniformis]